MKQRILSVFFVLPFLTIAQNDATMLYSLNSYYRGGNAPGVISLMGFEYPMLKSIEGTDVRSVTKTSQYKKKDPVTHTFEFNDRHLPVRITNGEVISEIEYESDSLVKRVYTNSKKSQETLNRYVKGNLVLSETFSENELATRITLNYNEEGNVLFSSVLNAKKKKFHSMSYEYDGSKLIRQRYMRDGKYISTWDYSCKPEGEKVQKKEIQVCRYREESVDGSYIQYERKEQGGDVHLYKLFYTADSVHVKSECWLNDTELKWETTYEDNTSIFTTYLDYDKGKIDYRHITVTNDKGQEISRVTEWKGRSDRRSERRLTYDEEGRLSTETTFYKNKQRQQTTYTYN